MKDSGTGATREELLQAAQRSTLQLDALPGLSVKGIEGLPIDLAEMLSTLTCRCRQAGLSPRLEVCRGQAWRVK